MTMSIMWHVKHNPRMSEWRVYDENWYYVAGYKTHAEAMAYADQQARTVTLELPPVAGNKCIDPDMSPAMFVEKTPTAYGIFLGHRHMVGVTPLELKPLGEYLLSLHYHHERNQK